MSTHLGSAGRTSEAQGPAPDAPPGTVATEATAFDSRVLFDRPAPPDYLGEWTERLAQPPHEQEQDRRSLVVFRLGDEWLAIPTRLLAEVTGLHPIHSVPHRTGEVLLGLVNIRGQLRICLSLHGLLGTLAGLPEGVRHRRHDASDPKGQDPDGRMAILQDQSHQWVFYADEVAGVHRIKVGLFRKVPSTFGKTSSYCQAVFDWNGRTVGCLDEERLLSALRSLCP